MNNYGYIEQEITHKDWFIGGQGGFFTPLNSKKLINFNNWEAWLPLVELQNNGGYDRMACVSYSLLNCLEILYIFHTKKEINFSDRFLAKASNTSKLGNSMSIVFDTVREKGLATESQWPDTKEGWNEYYKPIPQNVYDEALKLLDDWDIYREYVATYNKKAIFEALNYAPLQVIVKYASGPGELNPVGKYDHAVTLYGAEYKKAWLIYDHYTQTRKRYAWDYEFGTVLKPTFKPKEKPMFKPQNNKLYLLVEGKEQILSMGIDGKLIIFPDKADAIINSASRSGAYQIPKPITLSDYNSVKKINSKWEEIK